MVDRTITLIQDDGKEIVCDILFTYHYDKTGKDYVIFQPRGTQEVSAATYNPADGQQGALGRIETEEEWSMLEALLNDYVTELDDEEEGGCSGCCSGCSGCGSSCDCDGDCNGDCNN